MTVDRVGKCGTWTLGREIGRGAAGAVYLATDAKGKFAAVKVCLREELGDVRYERELRGAKLYKRIPPSEGLVRLLGFGECEWGFYMAMELADDEFGARPSAGYRPKTLSSVIAGEKALPVKESLKLGLALAKGLETLQRHHLLHRDIKPGNVIYVGGHPVLSDPGLIIEESEAVSLVGTPGYVPPERFTAAASDVYSLGLTLKAASFGRQVEELDKGPAQEADTGSPLFAAWWRILNKATHPDATKRYRSAKAFLQDLQFLRLQVALSIFSWKVPFFLELAVFGLIFLVFGAYANGCLRFGRSPRRSAKAVAEKVLDDFKDRRVKEDMPQFKRGMKAMFQSMSNMQREQLADAKKEIAELEDRIAADEERVKEAEKRGDKAGKDALEYGLASQKEHLKAVQEFKSELEKRLSGNEEKLKKMDGEIRQADEELLKLKEHK